MSFHTAWAVFASRPVSRAFVIALIASFSDSIASSRLSSCPETVMTCPEGKGHLIFADTNGRRCRRSLLAALRRQNFPAGPRVLKAQQPELALAVFLLC